MFRQIETDPSATLRHGVEVKPVATLKDTYGEVAQIWVDDDCYVLGLEIIDRDKIYVEPTIYIFREAFEVLKTLPSLK